MFIEQHTGADGLHHENYNDTFAGKSFSKATAGTIYLNAELTKRQPKCSADDNDAEDYLYLNRVSRYKH